MKSVVLNSNNLVEDTNNSTYRYRFPSTVHFKNNFIALSNVFMWYSWFNISAELGNNTFSYIWYGTTYPIVVPDGNYTIAQLNAYLQFEMIQNNHYLIETATGQYVYFLEITYNDPLYRVELKTYPVPVVLTGFTAPPGWVIPPTSETPQFVIPATNIRLYSGFDAGTYPPAPVAVNYNVVGQNTPQFELLSIVQIRCTLLQNNFASPNNIIYSFSIGQAQFGELIEFSVPQLIWQDIQDGFYDQFEIEFVDQEFKRLRLEDPNIVVSFAISKMER